MKVNLRTLCVTALFAALLCALSPLTIPMPVGVPITLQTAVIALTAFLLGAKAGTAAVICYLLIGAAGLPVFSSFSSGAAAFFSPTGGFIFAFPAFAFVLSLMFYVNNMAGKVLLGLAATVLLYAAGIIQFVLLTGNKPLAAASAFSLYFIKDVAVIFAAYFLCVRIRPMFRKLMQSK